LRKGSSWIITVALLAMFLLTPGMGHAAKKMDNTAVKQALKHLGVSNAEVLGVGPSPIKDLWMVYVRLEGKRMGAFLLTSDSKYLITGKLLDLSAGGKDITFATGVEKGYFPLPQGKSLKESNVDINTTGSPAFGPPKAPKVIVYFDPLCPYCLRELKELKPMANEGKIFLILKYFIVHGDKARELARNALCLYQQGEKEAFWSYLLSQGKLGAPQGKKCDEGQIELVLTRDGEEAKKLGLRGTPASVINDKLYSGYLGRTIIEKLLLTGKVAKGK